MRGSRTFELSKLNLLLGKNASGKSFVMQTIYVTFKALANLKRQRLPISPAAFSRELYWTIHRTFGSTNNFVNVGCEQAKVRINLEGCVEVQYLVRKSVRRAIETTFLKVQGEIPEVIYVPAIRSGVLPLSTYYLKIYLDVVREVLSPSKKLKRLRIFAREVGSEIVLDLIENLAKISEIGEISKNSFSDPDISKIVDKLLAGGSLKIDAAGNMQYIDPSGTQVPMSHAASSIVEVAPMLIAMLLLEKEKEPARAHRRKILLIEEPEAHLDPEFQERVSELITVIVRKFDNVIVVSSTHSTIVVTKLLNKVARKELLPGEISLYYLYRHKDVTDVRKVEVDEEGRVTELPGFLQVTLKLLEEYFGR